MSGPSRQEATDQLISRVQELVAKLQSEQAESIPSDEPYLASGSALKGGVKRGVFRAARPATRRYDRLATDLANVASSWPASSRTRTPTSRRCAVTSIAWITP